MDGRPNRRNKAAFSNSSGVSEDGASGFSRSLNLSIDLNGFGNTVELQFNEVAGNRPNLFVKSRVRYLYRKPRYNEFEGKRSKCSLYRGHS